MSSPLKASGKLAAASSSAGYDDSDEGSSVSKAEEAERKRAVQERIRREQAEGPPPDMAKRALVFDSMSKIISRTFGKGASKAGVSGETRGTYIFTWGAGYHGQLGRQFERGRKKYATVPKMVHLPLAIRQIACGGLHTAAVTDAGTVYTWGDARTYQLGYEPRGFTNQPVPQLVASLEGVAFIVSVACGQNHTVALTDKGSLISWGLSKYGQCGHNDRQLVKAPRKIRMDDPSIRFTEVSCGDKHTAALTTKGAVWSFGSCQQGQGGFDESPPVDKLRPTEVKALSDAGVVVASVVCGAIHTCMVSDEGQLYICGFGENFYANEEQNFFYRPVLVPFSEKVVQVACGQSHILLLTASADVYSFGSGSYGQLGQGVKGDLKVPRLILTGKNIAQVSAGRYHSVALTSFGTVYAFGCGENGQLGHQPHDAGAAGAGGQGAGEDANNASSAANAGSSGDGENILFPRVLEPNLGAVVGQIACGEHHTAVLTSTPWTVPSPDVLDWLAGEREEYALKSRFIKRSNHGLVRRDLLKIQARMSAVKTAWALDKSRATEAEARGVTEYLRGVKGRDAILAELEEDQRRGEERLQYAQDHPGEPLPQHLVHGAARGGAFQMEEQKDAAGGSESFRPDSARPAPTRPASGSGAQTARATMVSSRPRTTAAGSSPLTHRTATVQPGEFLGPQSSGSGGGGGDLVGSNAARANFLRESAGMVRRMKGIISDSGESSTDQRLRKTIQSVFGHRKDFDTLRNLTRKRLGLLESIQRKVASLRKNNESTRNRRRVNELLLKALKMKLSTVTIKILETEENRRNYALNIAHLKEEELERYYQLEALRKQSNDNDSFTKKINEMKLQSCEEANKSEMELAEFRVEIANFHQFIADQLTKFNQISQIAQARKEKRELEKNSRSAKSHEKINQRISRLTSDLESKSKEALSMQNQLESVNERLRYFEKRFQQIASATGLTNPDAIIVKFGLKEEIKTELNAEIKSKNAELAELGAELKAQHELLAQAKTAFQESKWKDVDVLQKVVHDAHANATHHQNECDRLDERLAYYKEGMLALLSMLPPELVAADANVIHAMEGADISHEKTLHLIQVLGDKLLGLSDMVQEGEVMRVQRARDFEDAKRHQEAANQARLAQEIAEKLKMSSMMRRTTAKTAAEYGMDDGDGQEDGDDDDGGRDDQDGSEGEADDGEDEQQAMQRTQPRQAIPAYEQQQQYQVQQY